MSRIYDPVAPGEIVETVLKDGLGLSFKESAAFLGMTEFEYAMFTKGRIPVDDQLAEVLADRLVTTKDVWLNLQFEYENGKEDK